MSNMVPQNDECLAMLVDGPAYLSLPVAAQRPSNDVEMTSATTTAAADNDDEEEEGEDEENEEDAAMWAILNGMANRQGCTSNSYQDQSRAIEKFPRWPITPDHTPEALLSASQPRLSPKDVPHKFAYTLPDPGFSTPEHLLFAQTFKIAPKMFGTIAKVIPGRSPKDCLQHYYTHKWDGRFQKQSLSQRNATYAEDSPLRKQLEELSLGDVRRKLLAQDDAAAAAFVTTSRTGRTRTPTFKIDPDVHSRHTEASMQGYVPLDGEIERLEKEVGKANNKRKGLEVASPSKKRKASPEEKSSPGKESQKSDRKRKAPAAVKSSGRAKKAKGPPTMDGSPGEVPKL